MGNSDKFSRKVSSWFLVPNALERPRVRLFCVPYAGGNATAFHKWGRGFKRDEIFSLQLPGRAFRRKEPCIVEIPKMIDAMAAAMEPHLDVPFVLFGHSMGAILVYELAHRLVQRGGPAPRGLIVSGRRAPTIKGGELIASSLPDDQFWRLIGELYGTPRTLLDSAELREMLIPVFRGDFRLLNNWNYTRRPPFDFPLLAMGGDSDPGVSEEDLQAWGEETTARFDHQLLKGGHMFLQPEEGKVLSSVLSFMDGLGIN